MCIMWHQTVYCHERELSCLHHFISFWLRRRCRCRRRRKKEKVEAIDISA